MEQEQEEIEQEVSGLHEEIIYSEPPFEPFTQIAEVEQVTKVFRQDDVFVEAKGQRMNGLELMAVEPKGFGETAWFKETLLPHHWYQYLNLLAQEPSAVLISTDVASAWGLRQAII